MADISLTGSSKYVIFKIDNEDYGADINNVTIIERLIHITKVPKTPSFVKGVINLRGEIIPIIDLRLKIGFEEIEETEDTRAIIIKVDEYVAGFIVDSVSEVIELTFDDIENSENLNSNIPTSYVSGVGKSKDKIITLLDFKKLTQLN